MPYRQPAAWTPPGESYRRRSVFRWLAWGVLCALTTGMVAMVADVLGGLDVSASEDVARGGDSEILGLACVMGLLAPALAGAVLYLHRARRSFVTIHDEGIMIAEPGGTTTLRWEEIVRIRRDLQEQSNGARREWGWWLDTEDGRSAHIAFDYPPPVRAGVASRMAARGVRPERAQRVADPQRSRETGSGLA